MAAGAPSFLSSPLALPAPPALPALPALPGLGSTLRPVQFHRRVPRPPLDASIELVWLCCSEPSPLTLERVLPTGAPQLIVNLAEDATRRYIPGPRGLVGESTAGTIVASVLSQFDIIDTAEQTYVAGAAFKPGGLTPFVRMPAHELAGADVPVETLWGRLAVAILRERLLEAPTAGAKLDVLEACLLERWTARAIHPAVTFALGSFQARPHLASVSDVTCAVGLSAKRFIERFKADVGLTPKRYCRVQRFQRAVSRAHRGLAVNWTTVALGAGYYDQAHFIHEFRSFAGMTPSEYQAAQTPFHNHVKYLQSEHPAV